MVISKNDMINLLRRTLPRGNRAFILERCDTFRVLGVFDYHGTKVIISRASYNFTLPNEKRIRHLYYWAYLPRDKHGNEVSAEVRQVDYSQLSTPQDINEATIERIRSHVSKGHK